MGRPLDLGVCRVYQLTINDILDLSIAKYQYYMSLLTINMDDILAKLSEKGINLPSDLDAITYLLINCECDQQFFLDAKEAFRTFLKEDVLFLFDQRLIVVGNPKDKRFITNDIYLSITEYIQTSNNLQIKEKPPENETEVQRKFRLKREERDRVKAKQLANNEDAADLSDILASIAVGLGYTPIELGELTIYQTRNLLERVELREHYHTELDMLMAGADSKKIKPKHWVCKIK